MTTAIEYSPSTGPTSSDFETCESADATTSHQLTLFAAASRASLSVMPGSDEARQMTVTSGRRCAALCKSLSPVGSLVRMFLASSTYTSTRCLLTWKPSVTRRGRLYFRLRLLTRPTSVLGSMWLPTPTVNAYPSNRSASPGAAVRLSLTGMAQTGMWPTPTAGNAKSHRTSNSAKEKYASGPTLVDAVEALEGRDAGPLTPEFVEWLMGYPIGWTDLEP